MDELKRKEAALVRVSDGTGSSKSPFCEDSSGGDGASVSSVVETQFSRPRIVRMGLLIRNLP